MMKLEEWRKEIANRTVDKKVDLDIVIAILNDWEKDRKSLLKAIEWDEVERAQYRGQQMSDRGMHRSFGEK